MARTDGTRRTRSRRVLVAGTLALAGSLAACSSDAAKEATIERLAVGTWACAPDAPGDSGSPFHLQIRDGGFSATIDDTAVEDRKLTGTWSVDGGDLAIDFTGAAVGGPGMGLADFDELTLESTGFTLTEPGIWAPSQTEEGMTREEWEAALAEDPVLDVDVDIQGTRAITLDTADGDPWTCTRQ